MSQNGLREVLAKFDFPDPVLDAWAADGITTLLPLQLQALSTEGLFEKSSLIIGPTSSGKTFVGELVCLWQVLRVQRSVYLVPFKAIAEEKYQEFQRKYGDRTVGARIAVSTGDRREQDRSIIDGDFDIAILTYEKLSSLIVASPSTLANVGALVVDEVQMLSDTGRGAELELLLTRARQIAPELQIVGLSAVVSDLAGFDQWLGALVIKNDHRPVALREGVISPTGKFTYMEWTGPERQPGTESFKPLEGNDEESLAAALAAQLMSTPSEQVVVFSPTVAKTKTLARQIASKVSALPPAKRAIERLAGLERTESVAALTETLAHQIAFHNGDLTLEERLAVEDGFRKRLVRCVVATTTLAMGVNLPASAVIIAKSFRNVLRKTGWQEERLSVAEYRNMSGRAGRFGLTQDPFGRSFLICRAPIHQAALSKSFVQADPSPLKSVLPDSPIVDMLLKAAASRLCETADGFFRFLLRTYAGATHFADAARQADAKLEVTDSINRLEKGSLLLGREGGKLGVTPLGRVCAASGVGVDGFLAIVSLVGAGAASVTDVALLASDLALAGPTAVHVWVTDDMPGHAYIDLVRQAEAQLPGPRTAAMIAELDAGEYLSKDRGTCLKIQATALAFVSGISSEDIERTLAISAGKARNVGALCSWVSDTAAKVAWLLKRPDDARKYEVLAERFLHGCSEDALLLSHVPHGLHRAERENLVEAGFKSFQAILDTTPIEIASRAGVNKSRVEELQRAIVGVLGEDLALERQQLARLRTLGLETSPIEALFVLKGTALEQAIENLLTAPFCPLSVARITSQREAEADLRLVLRTGHNGIAQVAAKDSPTEKVGINKSVAVLSQSPDLDPRVFITFGRPDFLDDAIRKAAEHAANGRNFKLITIQALAEMYVRFKEGKLAPDRVRAVLEEETGYIDISRIGG